MAGRGVRRGEGNKETQHGVILRDREKINIKNNGMILPLQRRMVGMR
jgi:hypothetical protein